MEKEQRDLFAAAGVGAFIGTFLTRRHMLARERALFKLLALAVAGAVKNPPTI